MWISGVYRELRHHNGGKSKCKLEVTEQQHGSEKLSSGSNFKWIEEAEKWQ
jgi:hypothetical protein